MSANDFFVAAIFVIALTLAMLFIGARAAEDGPCAVCGRDDFEYDWPCPMCGREK